MNQTHDPVFSAALRRALVALPTAQPRRHKRRFAVISAGLVGTVALGGVAAVAGLLPAGEVADPPLAPPVLVSGVGPTKAVLPDAPDKAKYLYVDLTCFDGAYCNTPGGGVEGPDNGLPKVQRDALPLTGDRDPISQQILEVLDPASGVEIDVAPGTHWRLYAVYTDGLNPEPAPVGNGKTLGLSGLDIPDLVPAVASNGQAGWVEYKLLTYEARPELTADGLRQPAIAVYAEDGTTQIGTADVSQSYTR